MLRLLFLFLAAFPNFKETYVDLLKPRFSLFSEVVVPRSDGMFSIQGFGLGSIYSFSFGVYFFFL